MTVPVNYIAVLVAAVVAFFVGFLWYSFLFKKPWMKHMGINPDTKATGGMGKQLTVNFIGLLVMSFVLQHALVFASTYLQATGVSAGLTAGFWNWLGFIAPVTLGSVLWEKKSWTLWIINNGYWLVSLLLMGIILAVWV